MTATVFPQQFPNAKPTASDGRILIARQFVVNHACDALLLALHDTRPEAGDYRTPADYREALDQHRTRIADVRRLKQQTCGIMTDLMRPS